MLILTRSAKESIMIGDIEVTVLKIAGNTISIGVDAPKDVPVHRGEIYEKIQKEQKDALPNL